ncbi:hypothetical protein RI129_002650 [Pyrocoelia pectoralis]|uniref:Uncharacterized protein n=1 Tax=Pyrocoelia pectoralis TaxID=417401 RepID=A0AAN7VNF3_9COLE
MRWGAILLEKHKPLRISGIVEAPGENTDLLVTQFLKNNLEVDCTIMDIKLSHRIGRSQDGLKRSIIVKFASYRKREEVFAKKKLLKKTGFVVSEDLTASRYQIYKQYCEEYRKSNVWTLDGRINIIDKNGKRRVVDVLNYANGNKN